MATMDDVRRAGLRESAASHAREAGRAGNRIAQEAETIACLASTVYGAAEARDFAKLTMLKASLDRHLEQAGAHLVQLRSELEALAAAEVAGKVE